MSKRQLYSALLLEQAVLILAGLLFGSAVGLFLSRLLLNGLPLFLGDALAKPAFVVVTDWSAIGVVYLLVPQLPTIFSSRFFGAPGFQTVHATGCGIES